MRDRLLEIDRLLGDLQEKVEEAKQLAFESCEYCASCRWFRRDEEYVYEAGIATGRVIQKDTGGCAHPSLGPVEAYMEPWGVRETRYRYQKTVQDRDHCEKFERRKEQWSVSPFDI